MVKLLSKFLAVTALLLAFATPAFALRDGRLMRFATASELTAFAATDGTVAYAIDTDVHYYRQAGSWITIASLASLANGATLTNAVDGTVVLTEGGEDLTLAATSNLWTLASTTGATFVLTPATTVSGDLTLSGGAGGLTFTDSASSLVLPDNDATALLVGSTGLLNLLTFDTGDATETVIVNGTTGVLAFHVATGTAQFAQGVTMDSTLTTTGLHTPTGGSYAANNAVTGADTLTAADCGRTTTVTAGIDTNQIVLPEASTVLGCTFHIVYTGADAGALLDISPLDSDSDGIDGGCTLAASVVQFSGTADADIGFTKATIQTGDSMMITSVGANQWVAHSIQGICANN
jgi:hypothetical protein